MKNLKKILIGIILIMTLTYSSNTRAQTSAPLFFDCVIWHQYYQGEYAYWVVDGWEQVYGPYDFHIDAIDAAEELLWRGYCDQIIDRSYGRSLK